MAKKYYGVKVGVIPGVYETWEQTEAQIRGFSGAQYKGFKNKSEAEEYVFSSEDEKVDVDILQVENKKVILLNDIINLFNDAIELYFKGSLIGEFTIEEAKNSTWINDRVCLIEKTNDDFLCVYLTSIDRTF